MDPWTTPTQNAEREMHRDVAAVPDTAAFMGKVYRWMAFGLGLTGLIAMVVAGNPEMLRVVAKAFLPIVIGELVLVLIFSAVVHRVSFAVGAAMFLVYCALNGVTFSLLFVIYTQSSIASAFFITGGTFAAMSVYGTVTRRDLSGWGSFLLMGLFGVVIAGVVNLFMRSDAMSFVISCASVVVFTGLTAWDTQKLKGMAHAGDDRLALQGALTLYLDFVNLFLAVLRLLGRRR